MFRKESRYIHENDKRAYKIRRFKQFYLLYGSESYLIRLYRDKLKEAILGGHDQMNFNRFEGKDIDLKEVNDIAQTLPFMANKRLILIEQSGLFKEQSILPDILSRAPESTVSFLPSRRQTSATRHTSL